MFSLFNRRRTFLIWAPAYTHRSSGVRALYRLCHHLNRSGYPSAMIAPRGARSGWDTPRHRGPVGDSIVIYPEIVSGNPLGARKVVRWALNNPGLLGGDAAYAKDEMVFAYDPQRLEIVSRAAGVPLGPRRVLWVGLVDPVHIYPDPAVPKTIDCSFTYKGRALRERFPLPAGAAIVPLEDLTPTMTALGDTLRRTRTLYSYDHYSNVLREAAICGCTVRVMGEDGVWHDPETCGCPSNILWHPDFRETYAARFHDRSFVRGFVEELRTRWEIAEPGG
jgi:hypothetical protein